jgi:acetyl esterase/lipase
MPLDASASVEELLAFCAFSEPMFEALFASTVADLEPYEGVDRSVQIIRGMDGNDITLFVHRPADQKGAVPGILHLHGGGMTILEAAGPGYVRVRDALAASGMVVVGVEFRNAGGKHGPHPFPAGLNDCTSALRWMGANKAALGVDRIVVAGESGGGNLTLATTLRAKQDGEIELIDGVFAMCPYISNAYAVRNPELPSLYENDGYFLSCAMMGLLAKLYDPSMAHAANPLAWPLHATVADLAGLPPHVISVNELDPLRDEGLTYFRKLTAAGVSVVGRTVNGTCHAGDLIFGNAMPEVFEATIRELSGFAHSL